MKKHVFKMFYNVYKRRKIIIIIIILQNVVSKNSFFKHEM